MKLVGDPDGLAELKKMQEDRRDYLKYVITEAKTNIDFSTTFTGSDGGTKYKLKYDRLAQVLKVEKL